MSAVRLHRFAPAAVRSHRATGLARVAAVAVFALGTVVAQAQTAAPAPSPTALDVPPAPGRPRPLTIATPGEQRLPNGLRVIVAERRGVPLVTARLVVLSGAELDPPGRAGATALMAGVLTRGTLRHTAPVLATLAGTLGGSLDSSAGWNESGVGITVTTPKLSDALSLLAEVAMVPAFAPAEIERYRTQALDELKVAYAEPGTLAGLAAMHALYGDGAYGHPVRGTPASLPHVSREDLQRLHDETFRPDNAVLVLAGDIDLATGVELARRHFGNWKAPEQPLPRSPAPAGAAAAARTLVIDMPGSGQAGVALALPASSGAAPERLVGEVADEVLGGGYSSRLNQEIRIKRGLSYGARSMLDERRDAGALRVSVQTKNPSAAEVVGLAQHELDRLMTEPVSEAELDARKAALIGEFGRSLETTQGLSAEVASLAVLGLPMTDLTQRIERLQAVTPPEVQAYASRYFAPAGRRVVVAGEASQFMPVLRTQAPQAVQVPQAGFDLEAPLPAAVGAVVEPPHAPASAAIPRPPSRDNAH
jgi:zinc protease